VRANLALVLLALTAHLTYFALVREHTAPDTVDYAAAAQSLRQGRGFTHDGVPQTRRTPGYPAFVAACEAAGLGFRGMALLQHLLAAAMTSALFVAARRMSGNHFVAVVAAGLFAIDLPTIVHANLILSETLFALLLFVVFVLAWRIGEGVPRPMRNGAVAGLILGLAVLVRPVAIAFFIPLAIYFAWTRRHAAIPLFVASALLFPALWTLRNFHATGVATLSSIAGDSILFYRAAGVLAIDEPGDFGKNLHRHAAELRARTDPPDARTLPHAKLAQLRARAGSRIVWQHPAAWAKLTARGITATLLGGGADAVSRLTGLTPRTATWLLLVTTAAALSFAIAGQTWLLRTNRRLGVLVLITVAYFVVLPAGAESYSRFRVPVVSMYAIAVAAGIECTRRLALTAVRASRSK